MSHSTKVLNKSENGRLIYCNACNDFQLDYKVAQFSLTGEQLESLINCINVLVTEYECVEIQNIPEIRIPTLTRKQHLGLTYSELLELNELVTGKEASLISLMYSFSVN